MNRKIMSGIAKCVIDCGILQPLRILSRRRHIILGFHRIRTNGIPVDPFDTCPSFTVEVFQKILAYVKQRYEIVSLRNLCQYKSTARPLAAITFDDGWRDNYDNAFPILKAMGIPATIFVTTGKIGSAIPFWQQTLGRLFSEILDSSTDEHKNFRKFLEVDDSALLNVNLYRKIVKKWKDMPFSELQNKFASNTWSNSITSSERERLFLTCDEIKEMSNYGIDFGSHTVNHVILTKESKTVVELEFLESRKALQEIIGNNIDMLAYPDGVFSEEIVQATNTFGYKIGVFCKSSG